MLTLQEITSVYLTLNFQFLMLKDRSILIKLIDLLIYQIMFYLDPFKSPFALHCPFLPKTLVEKSRVGGVRSSGCSLPFDG